MAFYPYSSEINQENLYPCVVGTKIGYKSLKDLTIRIPAQFDEAYKFHQGRALVRIKQENAFIDTKGKIVIELGDASASSFSEGFSLVKLPFSPPCLLDCDGSLYRGIDYDKYRLLSPISEGLIAARYNKKCGFIDLKGNEIIPFVYDTVHPFKNGIAHVTIESEGSFIIDKQGLRQEWWSDNTTHATRPFGSNLKVVEISSSLIKMERISMFKTRQVFEDNRYKIVNENGTQIGKGYHSIENLIDGRAVFSIVNNDGILKYGFLDEDGKVVIPPVFDSAHDFSDGLARVGIGGSLWKNHGYCDIWGNSTIDDLRQ